MTRKKSDKQREEEERKIREYRELIWQLAQETIEWAKGHGCWRLNYDPQEEIGGFFLITPSRKKRNPKPCWTESFGHKSSVWIDVEREMKRRGIPVVHREFQGHYLGYPGEPGSEIGSNINHTLTRMESCILDAALEVESGKGWNTAQSLIEKKTEKRLAGIEPSRIFRIFTHAMNQLLPARQMTLWEQKLLGNGDQDS